MKPISWGWKRLGALLAMLLIYAAVTLNLLANGNRQEIAIGLQMLHYTTFAIACIAVLKPCAPNA